MAKQKTRFICQECGAVYPRFQGQCYHCDAWNSIIEEIVDPITSGISQASAGGDASAPVPLSRISFEEEERLETGMSEFDRVTGGGLVPGSLVLIGGQPGIGKSTLLLSATGKIAQNKEGEILYVSGEESLQQIKMRADRLGVNSDQLLIFPEIDMGVIMKRLADTMPSLVIIDSIQTMLHPSVESAPGSVSQVRECAGLLQRFCKSSGVPVIIVGHVTRSGSIAGPMVLEHIVDAVLFFEGENVRDFRILRALKNRFGSTREIGVFVMESSGLRGIENPSEFFISHHESEIAGSVVVPVIEGTRTLLIEVQALVSPTGFGMPARRAEGVSSNRVTLLLAVMEKRARMMLGGSDVFINVAGGVQIDEPAADLGIALAIASSFRDRPLAPKTCAVGEIGLGGEIRGVSRIEERIGEALRMGFERILIPSVNSLELKSDQKGELIEVNSIAQAIEKAF